MDTLHATIEEFAAEGFTHVECSVTSMSRDEAKAGQLASSHLDGAATPNVQGVEILLFGELLND